MVSSQHKLLLNYHFSNFGNSCYLSSTLQMIFNIAKWADTIQKIHQKGYSFNKDKQYAILSSLNGAVNSYKSKNSAELTKWAKLVKADIEKRNPSYKGKI